ncbi:MAG: nuclear transport factor 2 family protein [Bacteroidetes bacterium]|nr:nuclear transport factor 2 family protein [Bacteroidota bacterium]
MFRAADQRNWKRVESYFDDTVLVDFSSAKRKARAWQTPQEISHSWAGILPGFDKTHHQLFDFEINESIGSATVHYGARAEHFIDEEVWVVEGTYDATLLKKGRDWVISELKFISKNCWGNAELPKIAMERARHYST